MASIHTKKFDKEADSIKIYNPNYDLTIGGGLMVLHTGQYNYKFRIFSNILSTCDLFQIQKVLVFGVKTILFFIADLKHRRVNC